MSVAPKWAARVLEWLTEYPSDPFLALQAGKRCVIGLRVGREIRVMEVTVNREMYVPDVGGGK